MSQSDAEIELTEALYRAANSHYGAAYATSDIGRALALAFRVRAALADSELATLTLTRSPTTPNELWIVKSQA